MKKNIGSMDRIVRFVIGVILLVVAWLTQSGFIAIGGLFSLFESFASWCLLYQLMGINTCPIKQQRFTPGMQFHLLFLKGVIIFAITVGINALATLFGWATWHSFLQDPLMPLSLDNYIFLFALYPFSFEVGNMIASKIIPGAK